MGNVVLITGVSRYLGGRLAAQLAADPGIDRVIGVDTRPPPADELTLLGRTEYVRADIRNPLIAKVIEAARVTTVVHAALIASARAVGGRVPMQELNVIGTMQLLAACQKSDTVSRVVLKSTTAVYGCGPRDPAVFTEQDDPVTDGRAGYAKDAVEVEGYVRGFARRRPDVTVTVLRMANVLGPTIDSALSRYLRMPVVPTVLGYDPRLQPLHERDAVEVARLSSTSDRPGTFNVAADGVVPLSQVLRRTGRIALPVPRAALGAAGRAVRNSGVLDFTAEEAQFLSYGRVVDTTRLRAHFEYHPRYSSTETITTLAGEPNLLAPALRVVGVASRRVRARQGRRLAVSRP